MTCSYDEAVERYITSLSTSAMTRREKHLVVGNIRGFAAWAGINLMPVSSKLQDSRFRIIDTDNFGQDYPDEKVISEGITTRALAQTMADALNSQATVHSARFYKVVDHHYVLEPGFQP